MALLACRECGAQVSTEAAACPKCGATNPTGKFVSPQAAEKKSNTVGCLGTIAAIVATLFIVSLCTSSDDSSHTPSELTPAQRDAKAAAVLAVAIKRTTRNPASFSISQVIRTADGALCLEYRGQNGFGGMNQETAFIAGGEMYFGPEAGFRKGWDQHCAGKSGEDITDTVESYAKVIDKAP